MCYHVDRYLRQCGDQAKNTAKMRWDVPTAKRGDRKETNHSTFTITAHSRMASSLVYKSIEAREYLFALFLCHGGTIIVY